MKSKINGTLADVLETEWKHRCGQLEMILPDWFSKKIFRLVSRTLLRASARSTATWSLSYLGG